MEEINQFDDKLKRKRDLATARVKKYREKKREEATQRRNLVTQPEPIEQIIQNKFKRLREVARECSRRYRDKKRLNAIISNPTVHCDAKFTTSHCSAAGVDIKNNNKDTTNSVSSQMDVIISNSQSYCFIIYWRYM